MQLLEAGPAVGGKLRQRQVGGQAIDSGPTVLTMRWVFEQIFEAAGSSLQQHLMLSPLSVLARHAWGADPEREQLDLHADPARSRDVIGRFAGARAAQQFDHFRAEAQRVHDTLAGPYIRSQKPSVAGMIAALGPRGLAQLTALGPLTTLWSVLGRRFDDPRLRQLFARYATYCGASPWAAPATLMLVAQVEMDGVWSVHGGMQKLADALAELALARGAEIHCQTPVARIEVEAGRARAVITADGQRWPADAVVYNGDADALARGLLGPDVKEAVPKRPVALRSLSALTACALTRTSGSFVPDRHNVFFDDDYASEFDDVFKHRRLPRRGTVYVCAQDRGLSNDATPAASSAETPSDEAASTRKDRLLLLVNAPPDGDTATLPPEEILRCEQASLALLSRCGLTLTHDPHDPQQWQRTTPQDYERLYPGSGGGLYGTATHGWMALFKRPGSTTRVANLFMAGGSVHPGPGVPMAAMSGSLAADSLMAHLHSTSRSSRVVTCGGTSTPSATTAVSD